MIIDPVLDFDPASGKVQTTSVQQIVAFVQQEGLQVTRIIETHVHADHLTGAYSLKQVKTAEMRSSPRLMFGFLFARISRSPFS